MRGRYALALAAAVLVALGHALTLLALAYGDVAEQRLGAPAAPATLAAARYAATLAPWSSRWHALQGWILVERRDGDGARAAYAQALRRAPADALLWSEYALALARLGRFDAELEHAVAQAQRLGPTSAAVQQATAELGLSYWPRGTARLHEQWRTSMRYALDHGRAVFLQRARARGQAPMFCRELAPDLGEQAWCRDTIEAAP